MMWFEENVKQKQKRKVILRWFGHLERLNESKMGKEVCRANVESNIGRRRPRMMFTDQIENVLKKAGVCGVNQMRTCMKRSRSGDQ